MNILAINGSPKGKRSNTWRLTSAFLEGIVAWEENGRKQRRQSKPLASARLISSLAWLLFLLEQDARQMLHP